MSGALVRFIEARLAEDEETAHRAGAEHPDWAYDRETFAVRSGASWQWVASRANPGGDMPLSDVDVAHIARHDPARVLREVDAKRRILAEVVAMIDDMDRELENEFGHGGRVTTGKSDLLLKLLAVPYESHPAYDPAWAPR